MTKMRGQVTVLVITIFILLLVIVGAVTPLMRTFITQAQSGASNTESMIWALIIPIFIISILAFIIGFSNLNRVI